MSKKILGTRHSIKADSMPCDRNICISNEYSGTDCENCVVTESNKQTDKTRTIEIKAEICKAIAELLTITAELPDQIAETTGNMLFRDGIVQNLERSTKAVDTYLGTEHYDF